MLRLERCFVCGSVIILDRSNASETDLWMTLSLSDQSGCAQWHSEWVVWVWPSPCRNASQLPQCTWTKSDVLDPFLKNLLDCKMWKRTAWFYSSVAAGSSASSMVGSDSLCQLSCRSTEDLSKLPIFRSAYLLISFTCFIFNLFSALNCPEGLVYDACAPGCPATCLLPNGPDNCPISDCQETCRCPDGQILDGTDCVTLDQCGCELPNGQYLRVRMSFCEYLKIVGMT